MRIAVIGPQNTGKSTFIRDLQEAFPQFKVPKETYRDVIRRHNLSVNRLTGTESQRLIRDFIFEQVTTAEPYTLFDRCLIDNYVYTKYAHMQGNIDDAFLQESEELLNRTARDVDLYLFIPSALAIPLENDELRDIEPHYVDTINRLFIEILFSLVKEHGIRVLTVGGTREGRIAALRAELNDS